MIFIMPPKFVCFEIVEVSWGAMAPANEFAFIGPRIAPHQNYPPRTVPCWIPTGLDPAGFKSGISLTAP